MNDHLRQPGDCKPHCDKAMLDPTFRIQHGELFDVTARPQRIDDVTFLPARVILNGESFSFSHPLHEYANLIPSGMDSIVHPGNDAPWALGRLTMLFGTTPSSPEFRPEKSCFHESFVAVLHSLDNLTIPFHCTDYYCKSSLIFSDDDPPDQSIQQLIATRFWALLFSDIEDVADYESRMFHSGACIWIRFGIDGGEPFIRGEDDGEN